jgi:hypothetical protein
LVIDTSNGANYGLEDEKYICHDWVGRASFGVVLADDETTDLFQGR